MCAFWLKMIGVAGKPWTTTYDKNHIGFRGRKPSGIHRGDHLVLYAVGVSKRIFALAVVTSEVYEQDEEQEWPYRVNIRCPLEFNLAPSSGVDVAEVILSGFLTKVARRSHARLTEEEYGRAVTKLREAAEKE